MWPTTERANGCPGNRTATTPLTLAAGRYPPEVPLARLVGRGAGALMRRIGGMVAEWRCRLRRAAAIRELRAWDDRMLKDIGLTRGEIVAAVDGRLDRNRRGRPAPTRGTAFGAPQGWQGAGRACPSASNGNKPDAAAQPPVPRNPRPCGWIEGNDRPHEGSTPP